VTTCERHSAWSVLRRYRTLPEPIRLVATASIGAAIGFVTYQLIYALNPLQPRTTTSWLLAFLFNIARQHGLHRSLTFTNSGPYWPSLGRAYLMYSGTAMATTTLNWYLTIVRGLNHNVSWVICMGVTATISLLFLKRFVFRGTQNQPWVHH
jgi:hypothetical protein